MEIDGHRRRARNGGERACDRDVPAVWEHGDLESGHAADRSGPRPCAVEDHPRRNVAGRGAHALHATGGDVDAGDLDALFQARAQAAGGGRVAGGDVGWARDAVGGAERAAEDVLDVEHRDHLRGLGRVHPARLGEADAMPHVHVVAEVLDLLRLREEEQVADLAEVRRVPGVLLERLEHLDRHPLQPDVRLGGELLAHAARALASRLRAQRLPLEEQHVDFALGELVGKRAPHDAAARDDYVSAFHSRTFPRTRR